MRSLFFSAGILVLMSVPASAQVNLEHGMAHEETFMVACEEGATTQTCRCVMERLEEMISFVAFAEEVVRHGRQVMTAASLTPAIASAQRLCAATTAAN